jgi:pentose-5-phosphate-3-epimerase
MTAPLATAEAELLPLASAPAPPRGWVRRQLHAARSRGLAYYVYRYRYLAGFIAIGVLSILAELAVLEILPAAWPREARVALGFAVGLTLSLALNVTANFHVPRRYLLRTSVSFVAISLGSFLANSALVGFFHATTDLAYGWLRLGTAGALFTIAYALHTRFTFNQARNFGIAVYASESENVGRIFEAVGHFCDHVHVDLVDETVNAEAEPVCLERIDEARRLWRGYPIALHIMSREPRKWAEQLWRQVDWFLFPCDSVDDLSELVFECRMRGKRAGVVWHQDVPTSRLLPLLPHVDFVMVLAIAKPGQSGQSLSEHGLAVARTLDSMRSLYNYDLMFDGGVKKSNIASIPGRYIVSASAVLNAAQPTAAARYLRLSTYRAEEFRDAA